jgi:hypothetical protein
MHFVPLEFGSNVEHAFQHFAIKFPDFDIRRIQDACHYLIVEFCSGFFVMEKDGKYFHKNDRRNAQLNSLDTGAKGDVDQGVSASGNR